MGKQPIELRPGEVVLEEIKADYWEVGFAGMDKQIPGSYVFTNQRVHFLGGFFGHEVDIFFADITEISTCNVGPGPVKIIPTGIRLADRSGKKHIVSVMKRQKYIDLIKANLPAGVAL